MISRVPVGSVASEWRRRFTCSVTCSVTCRLVSGASDVFGRQSVCTNWPASCRNAGVAGVVAVCDGVDDRFPNGLPWQFVLDVARGLAIAWDHGTVDLGHDKVGSLVNEFKDRAFVDVIGRDGFPDFKAVELMNIRIIVVFRIGLGIPQPQRVSWHGWVQRPP